MSASPVKKGGGDDGTGDSQESRPPLPTPPPPQPQHQQPTPTLATAPSEAAKLARATSPPPSRSSRNLSTVPQQLSRSRRSSQEFSPTRNTALSSNLATMPSAAAVQRALSAQRSLVLPTNVDGMLDPARPDRSTSRSGPSSPAWPASGPLKSPPPPKAGTRSVAVTKKADGDQNQTATAAPTPTLAAAASTATTPTTTTTATATATAAAAAAAAAAATAATGGSTATTTTTTNPALKRLASAPPTLAATESLAAAKGSENSAPAVPNTTTTTTTTTTTSLRLPSRSTTNSTLETVAESSDHFSDISPAATSLCHSQELDLRAELDLRSETSTIRDGEASGDGGEAKRPLLDGDTRTLRAASLARPHTTLAKRSLTSLSAKPKPPEPPRTMTVETEPVTSVPPLLVGDRGGSGRDGNGSIRTKGSNETIRPKKDKKKSTRKAPSLHSGPPSSKADLFEAKVASAVEEADTSDSDETFVYESNPRDNRTNRNHSRTPSATSLAAQDQYSRNRHGIRSGSHAIGGKKSMKFSSSAHNSHPDDDKAEGSHQDSSRRASQRHHHIGRYGKPAHASILDPNSPFTQASKATSARNLTGTNSARPSRPNSPRLPNGRLVPASRTKPDSFDMYDDVADDERTPLVGSVRISRSRHSRRPHSSGLRTAEYLDDEDEARAGCWPRWLGCLAATLLVLLVGSAVAALVLALSQPLLEVRVRHLQNILASEQELMLDLHVEAINANLFVISVGELDVNVFAESAYVGSSRQWHEQQERPLLLRWSERRRWRRSSRSFSSLPSAGGALAWPPFDLGGGDGDADDLDPSWPDPMDNDDPESPVQKMLLGRILEFDSPLTFEPSPLSRVMSSSVGEIRLPRPGNKTEVGGSERWERVLQHPFDLIVRGVLRYQLPLSTKTHSVKIASRAKICPGDDSDGSDGGNDGGEEGGPPKEEN